MTKRAVVLGLAGLGIPLAVLVLVLPVTWGYGGYLFGSSPKQPAPHITFIDPNGPAYRAGLREGDPVIVPRGMEAIRDDAGPVGTIARVYVIGDGRVREVSFAFVPYAGRLGIQQRVNKIVNGLAALAAFALAIVVVLRARDRRIGVRAARVLILLGTTALVLGAALVCNNAIAGELFYNLLPGPIGSAALWAGVSLLASFPPPVSALRRWLPAVAAVVFANSVYVSAARIPLLLTGIWPAWPLLLSSKTAPLFVIDLVRLVQGLPLPIACVNAMATTDDEHAAATRWLCSLWLAGWIVGSLPDAFAAAGNPILYTHYGDVIGAVAIAFFTAGIAYPILRHRLVDLNILISRATVFTTVSLIIVALFTTVEWGASKVLEQSLGVTIERASVASQALTLVLVIALGLSARSIHRFVEGTLTRTFFRKRLQGLAQIEACAEEVDVASDVRAIVDVAATTVGCSLDVRGCAIYLHDGAAYVRAAAIGDADLPERYGFNDVPPLKLRRWRSHIELHDGMPDTLFLPMLVRGDLLGFVACGAKLDRTAFLDDEIAALAKLAHHVGLAQATLSAPASARRFQAASAKPAFSLPSR